LYNNWSLGHYPSSRFLLKILLTNIDHINFTLPYYYKKVCAVYFAPFVVSYSILAGSFNGLTGSTPPFNWLIKGIYAFIFPYLNIRPVTVAARLRHEMSSPAWTLGSWVRIPLEAWMFVWVYSVFVLSCVSSGLATGWSLVQGVLPVVYKCKRAEEPRNNNNNLNIRANIQACANRMFD
jgi:hypothetical protein